jgi:hypothetical protein
MIRQKMNSHLWDFGAGGADACEYLDFFVFNRPIFLCFPIKICLGWNFIVWIKSSI